MSDPLAPAKQYTDVSISDFFSQVHDLLTDRFAGPTIYMAFDKYGKPVWPAHEAAYAFSVLGAFMRISYAITGSEVGCSMAYGHFRLVNGINNISQWEADPSRNLREVLDTMIEAIAVAPN